MSLLTVMLCAVLTGCGGGSTHDSAGHENVPDSQYPQVPLPASDADGTQGDPDVAMPGNDDAPTPENPSGGIGEQPSEPNPGTDNPSHEEDDPGQGNVDGGDGTPQQPSQPPEVTPDGALNVRQMGAAGDGVHDDSDAIAAAMSIASKQHQPLYFPAGDYLLGHSFELADNVTFQGNPAALSMLRAAPGVAIMIGTGEWGKKGSNVLIRDMAFEDVQIGFTGSQRGIRIEHNVFFGKQKTDTPHVAIGSSVTNSVVRDNVFLRHAQGRGLTYYRSVDALVQNNLFGLPDGRDARGRLQPQLSPELSALLTKAAPELDRYAADATQGCLMTGINLYSDNLDSRVLDNVFIGNDDAVNCTVDHVIYAKTSKKLRIIGNFLHGWPNAAAGGIKFKNAEDAVIAANTFDDTSLLLHVFPGLSFMHLQDVFVLNNAYRGRSNLGGWQAGFNMQEYATDSPWSGEQSSTLGKDVRNVLFAGNRFDLSDEKGALISFLNSDLNSVHAVDNTTIAAKPLILQSNFGLTPLPTLPGLPGDLVNYDLTRQPALSW